MNAAFIVGGLLLVVGVILAEANSRSARRREERRRKGRQYITRAARSREDLGYLLSRVVAHDALEREALMELARAELLVRHAYALTPDGGEVN